MLKASYCALGGAMLLAMPASAEVIEQRLEVSGPLDFDGLGRATFQPFDGALGTLQGASFRIVGTYREFADVTLRPGLDPVPGVLRLEVSFRASVFGASGALVSAVQTFAYDTAAFLCQIVLPVDEVVPLPEFPDVPLDAFMGQPVEVTYSGGSGFDLNTPHQGTPDFSGSAVLTYDYTPPETPASVPESGTLALVGGLLLGLLACRRTHNAQA